MMKKVIYSLVLAVAVGTSACKENQVPETVEQSFIKLYPTAEAVEWEQAQQNYLAEFEIGSWERSALFDTTGNLLTYSEEIGETSLPQAAAGVLQARYAQHTVDEVLRVHQSDSTYYQVELEQNNDETLLLFNEDGTLLKQTALAETNSHQPQDASLLTPGSNTGASADRLPQPASRWELPSELREVSGIALLDNGLLAAIQDEDGTVFLYDLAKKEISRRINFAGGGDYEGLVVAGNTAYVLRSDGALYEITDLQQEKPKVQLHASVLPGSLDTEGLAYDKANDRLLIAPKGYDKQLPDAKGLYAFTLADKKMHQKPVMTISLTQKAFAAGEEDLYDRLQPSSLEVNPANGELYVVDAENFRMIHLNQQGEVQNVISLDKEQLRQPEAFTFTSDGALLIASEGSKKKSGLILKFTSGF